MRTSVQQNHHRGQAGFTLIETTVALVVMMIGGLGIAAVFTYAIKNNTGARDRAAAIAVAQQELERLRNYPFDDAALTATSGVTTASVTSAERTYTVRTRIIDTTTTVKTIQIQVTPQNASNPWGQSSVTVVAQRASFVLGPNSGGP